MPFEPEELYQAFELENPENPGNETPPADGEGSPGESAQGVETTAGTQEGGQSAPGEGGQEEPAEGLEGQPEGTDAGAGAAATAQTPPQTAPQGYPDQIRVQEQARLSAMDEAYAAAYAGRVNPYTQQPIRSKADYDAYVKATEEQAKQQRNQQLAAAGLDPNVLDDIISNHPVIKQAETVIRQAEEQRKAAQETQARNWYQQQLREISGLDPEIKTISDLQTKRPDQFPRLMQMVGGGMTLAEAYKGLNYDTLAARRAAAAQQTVRNQAAGKAHMEPTGGQGKGGVEVPQNVKEEFRVLMPDITDAEMSRQYSDYIRKTQ